MRKKIKNLIDFYKNLYSEKMNSSSLVSDDGEVLTLLDKIEQLENRIVKLEDENISLSNELYRLENSFESKFESLFPTNLDLSKFSLGDS
jgi:predicted  nucleic acid-binding Zn-ribbon protein